LETSLSAGSTTFTVTNIGDILIQIAGSSAHTTFLEFGSFLLDSSTDLFPLVNELLLMAFSSPFYLRVSTRAFQFIIYIRAF